MNMVGSIVHCWQGVAKVHKREGGGHNVPRINKKEGDIVTALYKK
jgi:hypothetical protein